MELSLSRLNLPRKKDLSQATRDPPLRKVSCNSTYGATSQKLAVLIGSK